MEISTSDRLPGRLVLRPPESQAGLAEMSERDTTDTAGRSAPALALEERFSRLAERFDQLEFVIVEQFEPGMTGEDGQDPGNLRHRLDRIEAALRTFAGPAAAPDPAIDGALEAAIARIDAALVESAGAAARRDEDLASLKDAVARIETAVPPRPDMSAVHQGFARIATALSAGLQRLDAAREDTDRRLAAIETALADVAKAAIAADRATDAAPAPEGLEARIGALADRVAAAEARLSAASAEMAEIGRADALRALQSTVAELLAENRRLSSS